MARQQQELRWGHKPNPNDDVPIVGVFKDGKDDSRMMKRSGVIDGVVGTLLMFLAIGLMLCNQASCTGADETELFWATAYNCPYESELAGAQTVNVMISGTSYTLKASFLFGGHGIAMEGTGRTRPGGEYIAFNFDGGGSWVNIDDAQEFTEDVRMRYADLGITDFTGFYDIALSQPQEATYSVVEGVMGSTGHILTPWCSIAVDPSVVDLGTTGALRFENATTPSGSTEMNFRAEDIGGAIQGYHIDIYVGEGEAALAAWERTGDNRYLHVLEGVEVPPAADPPTPPVVHETEEPQTTPSTTPSATDIPATQQPPASNQGNTTVAPENSTNSSPSVADAPLSTAPTTEVSETTTAEEASVSTKEPAISYDIYIVLGVGFVAIAGYWLIGTFRHNRDSDT